MENSSNQQQKQNWKKKGLGWIPDYPDLRDYNLENEEDIKNKLRFKIEETTRGFELIANILITLFPEDKKEKREQLEEFKNQIFGNILFAKVKVNKILREGLQKPDTITIKYPCNLIKYESIFSNNILELKKYFAILVMLKYLYLPKNSEIDFDDPEQVADWMRDPNYNRTTKLLVKTFQHCSKILDDGIVGLETYTTFNECFSDKKNLLECQKNAENPSKKSKKGLSKIDFFAFTSLMSKPEFEIILNIFHSKVIDQIYKEVQEYIDDNSAQLSTSQSTKFKEKVFEYDFLKIIGVEDKDITLFEEIFNLKDINLFSKNILNSKNIQDVCKTIRNLIDQSIFSQSSNIIAVLQNSSVTEPIFSVITRILSPLSQWSNKTWEEMISEGFKSIESIGNQDSMSNNSNIESEPGYCQEELVESAIYQVISLLKLEIFSFIEQNHQKNDEKNKKAKIFVYFLLKKYLNQFKIYTSKALDQIKQDKDHKSNNSNIFDKQEVFEISCDELIFDHEQKSSKLDNNGQKKSKELFKTLDLYIPIIINNNSLKELATQQTKTSKKLFFHLPGVIDLSFWCSPVRDQGSLNSCTAFAAVALLEYFENRNFGKSTDASPLFLYKAARQKMDVKGDLGASIRETMKVLALFGVPPEESWPYEADKVDEEPPPYCYAYAQNYKTLKYFLLDYAGITTESLLFQIKAVLAAGFPCIFGLTLYTSAYEETNSKKGYIPYPDLNQDKVVGGHTAVVVGYDDYKFIRCTDRKHYSRGAFLIRNSWGTEWGVNGYGWLPYDYVLAGLTAAWWSLLKAEWFDESNFGPARKGGEGADPRTQGSGH